MTFNRLEQVNLEVLTIGVVVDSMSNVHDVDWIISHSYEAVRISSGVAKRIHSTPTDEIYVVRGRHIKSFP